MCYSIISAKTLGESLQRAEDFDQLLYPLTGYRVSLENPGKDGQCRLHYHVKNISSHSTFTPDNWDRTFHHNTVAHCSGLETWFGLCGWLIGQTLELQQVAIKGCLVSSKYSQRAEDVFQCPVQFDSDINALSFDSATLQCRLVHSNDSLKEFLETGPYQMWASDNRVSSSCAAIKSLIGTNFKEGLPSFDEIATNLHMSESSLRRHLRKEGTSYQQLKDECRRQTAIDLLCAGNLKISEIGEQVGYTETSSFVRSFRSWTGMSPKAFRDQANSLTGKN